MNTKRPIQDIKKMYQMRLDGKTLQEVGDFFGISRERVRQHLAAHGLDTSHFVKAHRIAVARGNPRKTNEEIAEILGVTPGAVSDYRVGMRCAVKTGSVKTGSDGEEYVSERFLEIGLDNELMPRHHPFDILLANGRRIDVKRAIAESPTSKFLKSPMYHFKTDAKRKRACDFFACVVPSGEIFIIPFSAVENTDSIRITWPKPKRSWSKYHQYVNRFDLLQK